MIDNKNEINETRGDVRQLYNHVILQSFLILLGLWNNVLLTLTEHKFLKHISTIA